MFFLIPAHCVLWKVRNQCHRWFDIPQNLLHCNKSLIPDRSQQYQRNALFGFSIVQLLRYLNSRNNGHFSLQIWKLKAIYIIYSSNLTEMHAKTCFALRVKGPSSLPTERNLTHNVKKRTRKLLEALGFDSRYIIKNLLIRRLTNPCTTPYTGI